MCSDPIVPPGAHATAATKWLTFVPYCMFSTRLIMASLPTAEFEGWTLEDHHNEMLALQTEFERLAKRCVGRIPTQTTLFSLSFFVVFSSLPGQNAARRYPTPSPPDWSAHPFSLAREPEPTATDSCKRQTARVVHGGPTAPPCPQHTTRALPAFLFLSPLSLGSSSPPERLPPRDRADFKGVTRYSPS